MPARLPLFSASSIDRVSVCAASVALPQHPRSSVASERGTAKHRYMQRRIEGIGREEALLEAPGDVRKELLAVDVEELLRGLESVEAEVSYAVHAGTFAVRRLGKALERNYVVEAGEIPGTVDVVARSSDGTPVVIDWKFGALPVAPAARNQQIMFAAACAMMEAGTSIVEARIVQIEPSGHANVSSATFDFIDVAAFRKELERAHQEALRAVEEVDGGKMPPIFVGQHCRFCPAEQGCPKSQSAPKPVSLRSVDFGWAVPTWLSLSDEAIRAMVLAEEPTERGKRYAAVEELEELLSRVKGVYRDLAKDEPIPLPDGKRLTVAKQMRSSAEKLEQLAIRYGASANELAACRGSAETRLTELAKSKGASELEVSECKEAQFQVRKVK